MDKQSQEEAVLFAFDESGKIIPVHKALMNRESNPKKYYYDPNTGKQVIPVSGHNTTLSHAVSHYRVINEEDIVRGEPIFSQKVLEMMFPIVEESGFHCDLGRIVVENKENISDHYNTNNTRETGFPVLYAAGSQEIAAFLALTRRPDSEEFLSLLRDVNNNERVSGINEEYMLNVQIHGQKGIYQANKIPIVPVLLRDNYLPESARKPEDRLFRPNPDHPSFHCLGDWMNQHLANVAGSPVVFNYFNLETEQFETVSLTRQAHDCEYTKRRYFYKHDQPEISDVCRRAVVTPLDFLRLEKYTINKDSKKYALGSHPQLHLARLAESQQAVLF